MTFSSKLELAGRLLSARDIMRGEETHKRRGKTTLGSEEEATNPGNRMKNGMYAFRFSGFTMKSDGGTYYLVGVGTMQVQDGQVRSGAQSSSITRMFVQGQTIVNAKFKIDGTIDGPSEGLYHVTIHFEQEPDASAVTEQLVGEFDLVEAGTGFWMVSTRTRNLTLNTDADEVVSGEAIFLG